MIYTRFGSAVRITAAKRETIKSPSRGDDLEVLLVQLAYVATGRDEDGPEGEALQDGEFINAGELRADGGWPEIADAAEALIEKREAKYG